MAPERAAATRVEVRRATGEDYEAACALLDEVDALHRDHLPAHFQRPPGPARALAYWLGLLADERTAVFLATTGGRPAGIVVVVVRDTPPNPLLVPRRLAVVDTLGVARAGRRLGIGRALMDRAAAWAAEQGAGVLQLEVYEFNQAAQAFYRELGYETLSRRLVRPLSGEKGDGS